jgi:hypothetical protein
MSVNRCYSFLGLSLLSTSDIRRIALVSMELNDHFFSGQRISLQWGDSYPLHNCSSASVYILFQITVSCCLLSWSLTELPLTYPSGASLSKFIWLPTPWVQILFYSLLLTSTRNSLEAFNQTKSCSCITAHRPYLVQSYLWCLEKKKPVNPN